MPNAIHEPTSWWRLRTQAFLVLGVLLFLIVFLGVYAKREAKRHTREADELIGANFTASSVLRQIEAAHAEEMRMSAKYRVTGDPAYQRIVRQHTGEVEVALQKIKGLLVLDSELAPLLESLDASRRLEVAVGMRPVPAFVQALHALERGLEAQRVKKAERLRVVARDLDKIIFMAFLLAVGVTSWLGILLYHALLKPLDAIKIAARRIREGELSYRIDRFNGFAELGELRREFNAMAAKLEELDRMKSDFLSTVSHELRTPLTAVKEGLHFLIERHASMPTHVRDRTLEVCGQSTKRLETMIQNLLNHAKMESGFYSFDERPKDFLAVIETSVQGVKPIAERRGIAIEIKVSTGSHLASFSTEGITHALENLLLNAIKYGDSAHPILVELSRIDANPVAQLEVRVTNHGKGLLPSELKLVFERFFRASNADGQKGVGLGLSVVKRIIEAHHGTVAAESEADVTTFWFRIPQRYESTATLRRLSEVRA